VCEVVNQYENHFHLLVVCKSLFLLGNATLVWYKLSSCVCPSVTSQYSIKMAKLRIKQTMLYVSFDALVF